MFRYTSLCCIESNIFQLVVRNVAMAAAPPAGGAGLSQNTPRQPDHRGAYLSGDGADGGLSAGDWSTPSASPSAARCLYNYFFLPPIGSFTIADPQNWIALFAFLASAIFISKISESERRQAAIERKSTQRNGAAL